MTKKKICFTLLVALLLTGCRMNNGFIGHLFGTWSLDEMTVDGTVPPDFVRGETSWSFQNNIIFIHRILPHDDVTLRVGTWEDKGPIFELDFRHSDDESPAGTGRYEAPTWLGFEPNAVERLDRLTDEPRHMVFRYTNPDGKVYIYTLNKTY